MRNDENSRDKPRFCWGFVRLVIVTLAPGPVTLAISITRRRSGHASYSQISTPYPLGFIAASAVMFP